MASLAASGERAASGGEVGVGRRALQRLAENPLQSLFGAAIIALLTFTLTSTHARFGDINERFRDINERFDDVNERFTEVNRRIDATNERITRLEEKTDARFDALEAKMDARFEALEASVAEINLKLTALIAALNMSAQVDAAQEGRIINPEQAPDPG